MAANLLALSPGNLSLIVSHVSYAGGRWIDCYSLATLARTCRQLWSPAVAELWRELESFTPLLSTLPEDLYATTKQSQMDEMDMDDGALVYPHLLRVPTLQDFERWTMYAHFVHVIDSHCSGVRATVLRQSLVFSHDIWTSLTRHGPHTLLPNLFRLSLDVAEAQFLSRITHPLPFSRSLVHLHLLGLSRTEMLGILDKLAASVRQLKVLDVAVEIGWESAAERDASGAVIDRPLETCLLTWCDLRVLRLRGIPVSSATISAIATLQLLEELNIQTTSLLTPLEGGLGTFAPRLKTLHIHIDFLSWVTKFFAHISSSRLERLSVILTDRSPAFEVFDFCTVIAQHQSRLALREIRILQALMASPDTTIKPEFLRPLLKLPQLAVLSMEGRESFGIDIDDSFLSEMASAWPELEVLKLDPLDPCLPATTWAGLVHFAHLCPKLRSIKLGIDTYVDAPAFDNLLVRPAAPSSLVSLHVGRAAPPGDPVQLAAFLFEHFPLLDSVSSYPRREDYAQTILGWKKVKDILYELRLVRRQERNWSQGQGPVASPRDSE